jgi:hypothetical protein
MSAAVITVRVHILFSGPDGAADIPLAQPGMIIIEPGGMSQLLMNQAGLVQSTGTG